MIGVDTNVLVRLFTDEEPQSTVAAAFFAARSASDPAYLSLVVVAEFVWVLRRRYGYTVEQIGGALQGILDSTDFVLESRELVETALADYTHPALDFADLVIAHAAQQAGASSTVTFDQDAAKLVTGMELLK